MVENAGVLIPVVLKPKTVIPDRLLMIDGFLDAWNDWLDHLKQKRKIPTDKSIQLQFKKLMESNNPIGMIYNSIEKGYQGLFPDTQSNRPMSHQQRVEQSALTAMQAIEAHFNGK